MRGDGTDDGVDRGTPNETLLLRVLAVSPGLLVDQFADARDEALAAENELARDAGYEIVIGLSGRDERAVRLAGISVGSLGDWCSLPGIRLSR
jgi:hypothetical protein